MYQTIPLLDPATNPFKGRMGSAQKRALKKGFWSATQNIRWNSGAMQVRYGSSTLFNTTFTTGSPSGAWTFLGGASYKWGDNIVVVMGIYDQVVTKVRLYMRFYAPPGPWSGWFEQTESSGQFGDTRMQAPVLGNLQFQAVNGTAGLDGCLVQNGLDEPRYIKFLDTNPKASIMKNIAPPSNTEADVPVAWVEAGLPVSTGTWTATSSGAGAGDFKASTAGVSGAGTQYLVLSEVVPASPVLAGKVASFTVALGSAVSVTSSSQLVLLAWCGIDSDIWYKLKIEVAYGATPTWETIYDPSNGNDQPVYEDMELVDTTVHFRQVGIPYVKPTSKAQLRGIRFTALQDLPANAIANIIGVLGSGCVQGGAQYAVSFYSTQNRTESPAKILRVNASAVATASGVPDQKTVDALRADEEPGSHGGGWLPGVVRKWGTANTPPKLVVSPNFYYTYKVPAYTPTQAAAQETVDNCILYRKDPGEEEFTYVGTQPCATFTAGNWTWDTSTVAFTGWSDKQIITDKQVREGKVFSRRAPTADQISPPTGYAMCRSNGRLYIGVARGAGSNSYFNSIYVSELDYTMRFRALPHNISERNSESSGYLISLGDDSAMKLIAARITGETSQVYCFGRESLYRLKNLSPEPLCQVGTGSPDSCCEDKGVLYWLDPEMNLMQWGGKLSNLSRNVENTVLTSIQSGYKKYVTACAFSDNVYISHGDGSETRNYKILVFDTKIDAFVSDDLYPATLAIGSWCVADYSSGVRQRFYIAPTGGGYVFQDTAQTTDAGTAIPIVIQSKEFAGPGFIFTRRLRVECDGQSNTLVSQRIRDVPAGTTTGELALTGSGRVDKFDSETGTDKPIGSKSKAASFKLSGNMTGGTQIYAVWAEIMGTMYSSGDPG